MTKLFIAIMFAIPVSMGLVACVDPPNAEVVDAVAKTCGSGQSLDVFFNGAQYRIECKGPSVLDFTK